MDTWTSIELLAISIFVVLSAFFSGSEAALLSVNKIRIKHLADNDSRRAKILLDILRNPEQFIAAILIGNNVVNISASVLATDVALHYFGDRGVAIATGTMTLLILVVGEVLPKTIGSRNSETVSMLVANPIKLIIDILRPFIWVLTTSINAVIAAVGIKDRVRNPFVTEDEIKLMLKVGEKEGTIEQHEREMIHKVFEYTDEKAHGIMTPRDKMVCISENETLENALVVINESGHSRIPVYSKNIDHITGMVYAKDLLRFRDTDMRRITVHQIQRPILITRAGRKISSLLKELQQKKIGISVVVDDTNRVIGLVSIEDILEEIVGEIFDEYDVETEKDGAGNA
ncbi:MAG TPA: HlyC/CorC family transporter [Candidatus Methanoperedenaceae archaeon]|nr:HlyC/CorC family transporter [Candidatus Methanoperedenaceae archaeon]